MTTPGQSETMRVVIVAPAPLRHVECFVCGRMVLMGAFVIDQERYLAHFFTRALHDRRARSRDGF